MPETAATRRILDRDSPEQGDETRAVDQAIARNASRFDINAFPYKLSPGIKDAASAYFQPERRRDFTALALKADHHNRPLWIDGWGKLTFETFHTVSPQVQDFLIAVAEPVSRLSLLHEYELTTQSLYAASSVGLTSWDITKTLQLFLKNDLPSNVIEYITHCGKSYGKVKIVLRDNKYFVECAGADPVVSRLLLNDPEIRTCRVQRDDNITMMAPTQSGLAIAGTKDSTFAREAERLDKIERAQHQTRCDSMAEEKEDEEDLVHAFQIQDKKVSKVAERCLTLHYPALEEYDFRNDHNNPNLEIDLRPTTIIRPFQEQSLSKMFGNGRAKSGIIVLPCGAGKSLVGVAAACTIKKAVVILANSSISALQWGNEFQKWSNIDPEDIAIFSSTNKSTFPRRTGIIITTYSMVTNTRERAEDSARMMNFLQDREWGLMLLDEVHVVPAQMFRKVIGSIKAHSKLGLTATLLREDDKINDLNFLIGPKLYEANWSELSEQGYIARVQCAEVWCSMSTEFHEHYLNAKSRDRSLFCVLNPAKFHACQYLIKYHESRGDKIIVFSDNVYALEVYAKMLMKPFLFGGTSDIERQEILDYFSNSANCSTLFLSKIGDTSLDLPEATCLIQISAQFGSRRQEAQRLGRILRAKRRNETGFNAFFYSLVSKDTVEMIFSSKRQSFLVDQGYAFKVITRLEGLESTPDLAFNDPESRRDLLMKVLSEIQSKSSRQVEERESAGLMADGNVFNGPDEQPLQRVSEMGRSATERRVRNRGPHSAFFRSLTRQNDRRRQER